MVDFKSMLDSGMAYLLNSAGNWTNVTLSSYTFTTGSDSYDDQRTVTQVGSTVTSGLEFPVGGTNSNSSSVDAMLLEQGKLKTSDKKLYLFGNISISGNSVIGLGSPTAVQHTVISDGIQQYSINGTPVYKKIFVRVDTAGSLF